MSTKMYKVKSGASVPVEVTAEIPSYPNLDSEGDTIFGNTHFFMLEDAWPKLLREVEAWVSLATMTVNRLKKEMCDAQNELADAAIARINAVEEHRKWAASRPTDGEGKS